MATNTINISHSQGDIIDNSHTNELGQAISTALVGRTAAGVPSANQSLGTVAFPSAPAYITNLILAGSAVDPSLITAPANVLTSGKTRTTSNQPAFITPAGAAGGAEFDVEGLTVNLVYDVNGVAVSISTDITKDTLTTAPGSNNTCLVNDTDAADGEFTRQWGEEGAQKEYITIGTVGSEITSRVGQFAAFKLNDGANDEYFVAYIESATKLSKIYRGFFYNSSLNPVNRIKFAHADTITLMQLGYVFAQSNGTTIDVTYTAPVYAFTAPAGPATGDYWYKIQEQKWYRYNGSTWVIIERAFIGWVLLDDTDCLAARCMDFYDNYRAENNIVVDVATTEIVRASTLMQKVNVAGNNLRYITSTPEWNITTDLATSADMYDATEQASRRYYLYIKDDGDTVISDITPYKANDKFGYYHPHNPWRAISSFENNAGSNIISVNKIDTLYFPSSVTCTKLSGTALNGLGTSNTAIAAFEQGATVGNAVTQTASDADGASFFINKAGLYRVKCLLKATSSTTEIGITLNSAALSTNILTITDATIVAMVTTRTTNPIQANATLRLEVGDILRGHTNTGNSYDVNAGKAFFLVERIGD